MLILNSRKKITVAALFIAGVVLGTLLCGQMIGYSSDKINIYGNFVMRTLKYENISSVNLLKYIAAYRIKDCDCRYQHDLCEISIIRHLCRLCGNTAGSADFNADNDESKNGYTMVFLI